MKNKIQSFFITVILLFPLLTFAALDTPIEDFTDNNDGTVTHNKTGLTWQRCAVGQTWTGSTCSGTPSIFTWDSASKLTSTFAGKSDWHVPRIDELKSIIEHSSYSPSLNKTIFPNSTTSAIYIFWSGSSYVSDSQNNLKWSVSFQHGDLLSEAKSLSRAVRLVRGSSTLSSLGEYTSTNDFIDNKDGTVVHKKTVLMWQRCSVGQTWTGSTCTGNATTMHHLEATQQKSNFSSYSDWRLPTINELSSIVEYKNYSASINKSIFPNATSTWFWTISDDFVSPNAASWIVDFINGTEGSYLQGYDYAVRLVRNSAIKDFTDNKDGTVTHNKTGLTWQRCAVGQTWTGSMCNGSGLTMKWTEAVSNYGNKKDCSNWRLPRIDELYSISEHSDSSVNSIIFANSSNSWFWASSLRASNLNDSWMVRFIDGDDGYYNYSNSDAINTIRLVKGGADCSSDTPTTPNIDFTDNKDGTVTHNKTGLTWQRCAVGQTWTGSMCNGFATPMNYTAANQQTSTLAGYSDWRIPSVNELKSIVEYKNYSPSINNVIFPSTPVNWFWSASNSKDIAWVVSFYDGNDSDSSGGKLNNYLLRLVRGTWSKPSPRIAPDISTTITQSTSNVKVNANVIYTASIKNNGTSDTGNVKIIFYLPPRNISTATLPSNCLLTEKNTTCTLTNLAIGESISQSINVLYTKSGGASISALAISDKEDADISNNIGRVVTSIKK